MGHLPLADDGDWPILRLPDDGVSGPGFYEELEDFEPSREFSGYAEAVREKAARLSGLSVGRERATPAGSSDTRRRFLRPSRP